MSIARRSVGTARQLFAIGEGQLAIGRGVRTAFALLVPVIAADIFGQPLLSWAALGGWLGSLADKGGSYRTRASTMTALLVLGAACALGGTEVAHSVPVATVTMLLVGIIAGLARVYGDEGSTVGLFISIIFAVALGSRSEVAHVAMLRAGFFAVGVAWAMVLSLVLWPLHPFRPARRAVAHGYTTLASFAQALEAVARSLGNASAPEARTGARALHASVRLALESARLVLIDVRRGKQGRSPRGEQLLVLTEGAEQLFGTLVAIDAELEAAHESGSLAGDEAFARAFGCLARTLELLAAGIDDTVPRERSPGADAALPELAVRTDWPNVHLAAAATLLARLSGDFQTLLETAANIDARASQIVPRTAEHPVAIAPAHDPWAWLRPLRVALSTRSLPARHGLRMGVAAAAAVWLSFALDITHGYWSTITTLIVLQPYAGATVRKTLQRVAGSVVGGIIAAALAVLARTKLAIAGVMVPFTIGAVAVLPLNYGVYVVLLTPVFVLLAEPHPGDWGIAGLRVANTILGGIIALVSAQLLWPTRELSTFGSQLGAALRDLRQLLALVTSDADAPSDVWHRSVDDARRRFGLAATNAEATMQRLITEDSPEPRRVEAAMTILTYGRRIASTLAAMTESRVLGAAAPDSHTVGQLAAQLESLIAPLEGTSPPLEGISPPLEVEKIEAVAPSHAAPAAMRSLQDAQLERLRAQLDVMRRAVTRYQAA